MIKEFFAKDFIYEKYKESEYEGVMGPRPLALFSVLRKIN